MKTLKHNNEQNIGELKIGNRILLVDGVSVSFDGFKALNNLSFSIDYGELRCIIGANGAGKSTMMDVVTGKTKPDEGHVVFGEAVDLLSLDEPTIAQIGIGRKFQKPTVFQNHTVFENLELAMKDDKRFFKTLFSKLSSEQKDKIEETMKLIGLKELYNLEAGILSHGQKQWLEIGMLLMQRPKLILLDEPVAGMTDAETEHTAELCLRLKKNHTLIVVEHDMTFIDAISEKVTVLANGAILAEGTLSEVQNNEAVIETYLGR